MKFSRKRGRKMVRTCIVSATSRMVKQLKMRRFIAIVCSRRKYEPRSLHDFANGGAVLTIMSCSIAVTKLVLQCPAHPVYLP